MKSMHERASFCMKFREVEKENVLAGVVNISRNMVYGMIKKKRYVRVDH